MKLAAIVLAAGSATRFGSDKLAAPVAGEPLVYSAIRAARAAPVERVIVVTRERRDIGQWPDAPPVSRLNIASPALSASLRAGIVAAGPVDGAFVFLGDMPRIPHAIAGQLADALGAAQGDVVAAVPRRDGRSGHPVLLSARLFADIAALSGDAGAGRLLAAREDVLHVDCDDPGILLDIDRPGDLERLAD